MKEKPHYEDLLTEKFFIDHYVEKRMSYPKIAAMLKEQGHNIAVGTVHKYAKKLGIGRNRSEAKRNREPNPLDFETSYLTEGIIEAIDGFLLGDGGIDKDKRSAIKCARLKCGVEHKAFCEYLLKPFKSYRPSFIEVDSPKSKNNTINQGLTYNHPDFYDHHKRWYPGDGTKQPPYDVRITPKSVMMWYLGDGSLVQHGNNAVTVRLSTDGFSEANVEMLVSRLIEKGIECHRNGDNRIYIEARGIAPFFDFIGRESPVECYKYKFDLPEWRFEAKRMKQVAEELKVDYSRLSHLVKIGKIGCYRASEKGRPRFLAEHIEEARKLVASGDLY